ncbi:hypothetical protein [Ferrimonas balearica]|uniref:hypothetical protein n=1 Tax=Ferrimonas balearica TaxID=44012 RepID=UPI001C57F235|nr:hypothetical protein [Ferrimonas balearica]MBW3162917.1 hypothetical protein [Ferrimonas balearica]
MLPVEIFGDTASVETRFLVLVCELKGTAYRLEPKQSDDQPLMQHQGHPHHSMLAAAAYLDARFPEVPLTPEVPAQIGLMWEWLARPVVESNAGVALLEAALNESPFLAGEQRSLADLCWCARMAEVIEQSPSLVDWQQRVLAEEPQDDVPFAESE